MDKLTRRNLQRVRTVTLCSCLLLAAPDSFGDELRIGGDVRRLMVYPMETFFDSHLDLKPQPDVFSTGDLRQYVADWDIEGDSLFLAGITVERYKEGGDSATVVDSVLYGAELKYVYDFDTAPMPVLSEVFPGKSRVFADWYTGYLVAPSGQDAAPCAEPYPGGLTIKEHYAILVVSDGLIRERRSLSAEEFCEFLDGQFRAYQKTEEYRVQRSQMSAIDDSITAVRGSSYVPSNNDYWIFVDYWEYLGQLYEPARDEE